MQPKISEIEIEPVKPHGGLVAFASFVFDECLYCGSIGIMTRPDGSYRLCFPTRKLGMRDVSIVHPINKATGEAINHAVLAGYENVVKGSYGRHSSSKD